MVEITRLPTKFGQGHTEAIAFFQDTILPPLIENKIVCLAVRGIRDDGTELHFTMTDISGKREHNVRLIGLLAELQSILISELQTKKAAPR